MSKWNLVPWDTREPNAWGVYIRLARQRRTSNQESPGFSRGELSIVWVKDYFMCYDGDKKIVLSHYPIAVWDMQHYDSVHFYGHVHSNVDNRHPVLAQLKNAYNVGVDVIGYAPKTADQIIKGGK